MSSSSNDALSILRKSPSVDSALSSYGERSPSPQQEKVKDFAQELLNSQEMLTRDDVAKLMTVEDKIAQSSPETASKICKICAGLLVEKPVAKSKTPPKLSLQMTTHMLNSVKDSPEKTNKICELYLKSLIEEDKDREFRVFPTQISGLFKDLDSHHPDWAEDDFNAKVNVLIAIASLLPGYRAIAVEQLGRTFQGGYQGSPSREKANINNLLTIPKDPLKFIFEGPGGIDRNNEQIIPSGKEIRKESLEYLGKQINSKNIEQAEAAAFLLVRWQGNYDLQEGSPLLQKATRILQEHKNT